MSDQPLQISKKTDEVPTLRSVANAIRTGIFIEKIYSRMSTSQLMVVPPEVEAHLNVSEVNKVFTPFETNIFRISMTGILTYSTMQRQPAVVL